MTHTQPFLTPARTQSAAAPSAEFALCLLGPSSAMAQLWAQMRRLAPHVRTVLLTGEPDCGQEAVARVLLDLSPHAHRSFVQLTAAEAEARLLRSAGFTSLPNDVFLFIPDIDQFSAAAQDGLLRLLRTRRSRALTVVAAAPQDLRSLAGLGRFSPELADALGSVRIAIPSLRQRAEDLPMLINHLLSASSHRAGLPVPQTTDDFLHAAMQHTWGGNLRELGQTLTSLCADVHGQELRAADLLRCLITHRPHHAEQASPARLVSLDTVVQEHIYTVLRACQGNKVRASEVLGISRSTLYRMLDSPSAAHTSLPIAS